MVSRFDLLQADKTFLYQLVFDPRTRKLRPLEDYPDDAFFDKGTEDLSFAGKYVDDDVAFQLSLGNLDLRDLTNKVHDFNPDSRVFSKEKAPKYGKRAKHDSIW